MLLAFRTHPTVRSLERLPQSARPPTVIRRRASTSTLKEWESLSNETRGRGMRSPKFLGKTRKLL